MKKIIIAFAMLACPAFAADLYYDSNNSYVQLQNGPRVPALFVYATDGNGTAVPIGGGLTNTELRASPLAVSASSWPLPTSAATSALQTTGNSSLSSLDTKLVQLTLNGDRLKVDIPAGASGLTDSELRATPVPVSGTVAVTNAGITSLDNKTPALGQALAAASTPVVLTAAQISTLTPLSSVAVTNTGTFAVQAASTLAAETTKVIGTVNVAASQTIATTNAGTFAVQAAQSGVWTVQPGNTANTTAWKVDGSAVTQPVSGTFWQATQPVSGTITANAGTGTLAVSGPLTDAQLRAAAVPVSGTVTANQGGTWTMRLNDGAGVSIGSGGSGTGITVTCTNCGGTTTPATYVYSNGSTSFTPVATPNVMLSIQGSASKTIKVRQVLVCATATAAGHAKFYLARRSTAPTSGTSATVTATTFDTANAAATAVIRQWSVDPSAPGNIVGVLIPRWFFYGITAGTTVENTCVDMIRGHGEEFPDSGIQELVLRGTSEYLNFEKNDEALPAGFAIQAYRIVVTEE